MKILVFEIFEKGQIFRPSTLKTDFFFQKDSIKAYVHIEYSTYQLPIFREIEGGLESTPPPGPCGTEKSVLLRGLSDFPTLKAYPRLPGELISKISILYRPTFSGFTLFFKGWYSPASRDII